MVDAVILCAGKGSRLGKNMPKCLLKINGKTLLNYIIEYVGPFVNKIIIVINDNNHGQIMGTTPLEFDDKVFYILQSDINGTGGAVFAASELISDEFIVLNGDCYYKREDIIKVLGLKYGILTKSPNPMKTGGITVYGKFLKFIYEKENHTNLCNTGLYKLDKSIFDYSLYMSKRGEYELTDLVNQFAKDNKVVVIITDAWTHITYNSDVLTLSNFLKGYGKVWKCFGNVLFLNKKGKLLLHKRSSEDWLPYKSHYQILGGLVEDNENPLECVVREMKEELCLYLTEENFYFICRIDNEELKRSDYIFLCSVELGNMWGDICVCEGAGVKYFTLNELSNLLLVPADRIILTSLPRSP